MLEDLIIQKIRSLNDSIIETNSIDTEQARVNYNCNSIVINYS